MAADAFPQNKTLRIQSSRPRPSKAQPARSQNRNRRRLIDPRSCIHHHRVQPHNLRLRSRFKLRALVGQWCWRSLAP
ncbi:hypothetical protein L484_027380 [Morus notabilis]|uniref:Uncharacterized protein n=1 Tax=Morus notabilis TaxID=981085 RepID=W9QJZ9_9ROSA|nr:hypothetical protein L484_027380 [Morus notabilis]